MLFTFPSASPPQRTKRTNEQIRNVSPAPGGGACTAIYRGSISIAREPVTCSVSGPPRSTENMNSHKLCGVLSPISNLGSADGGSNFSFGTTPLIFKVLTFGFLGSVFSDSLCGQHHYPSWEDRKMYSKEDPKKSSSHPLILS